MLLGKPTPIADSRTVVGRPQHNLLPFCLAVYASEREREVAKVALAVLYD